MPDREFIHATSDVESTLQFAFDSSLQVRLDEPQDAPTPFMLSREDIAQIYNGVLFLYFPEWVYGPLDIGPIPSGHNRGKYCVSPGVNCSPITVYFHGERTEKGQRIFGSCLVSYNRDWLEMPAKIVRETPPEVKKWWKRIVAHLSSGIVIKAGVHRYHVSKGVLADPEYRTCLPPFDFIPWPPEIP